MRWSSKKNTDYYRVALIFENSLGSAAVIEAGLGLDGSMFPQIFQLEFIWGCCSFRSRRSFGSADGCFLHVPSILSKNGRDKVTCVTWKIAVVTGNSIENQDESPIGPGSLVILVIPAEIAVIRWPEKSKAATSKLARRSKLARVKLRWAENNCTINVVVWFSRRFLVQSTEMNKVVSTAEE
jgi:hypothetical protein